MLRIRFYSLKKLGKASMGALKKEEKEKRKWETREKIKLKGSSKHFYRIQVFFLMFQQNVLRIFRWIFLDNDQVSEVRIFSFLPSSAKHKHYIDQVFLIYPVSGISHAPLQLGSEVASLCSTAQGFGLAPYGTWGKYRPVLFGKQM